MDKNLVKIIPFTKPYQKHVVWNIIFNVLYALFSTISMLTLLPMLQVLFKRNTAVKAEPIYSGLGSLIDYGKQMLFYQMNTLYEKNGPHYALLLAVALVVITFMFKNLFNYLASFHLMHLKNGVLKDLRVRMFNKIIELPVSYYSEKRKGDVMARMLGDVGEVQNSFFSILELIIKEPLTIVFAIITMFSISVKLTLFVFVF
ncbi:MAG: ABC transporter ATP-binding protein, partial [Flavobacterium sp.]|nr:ABC transporter ATP-binding protein [Flavobacterium sp.]